MKHTFEGTPKATGKTYPATHPPFLHLREKQKESVATCSSLGRDATERLLGTCTQKGCHSGQLGSRAGRVHGGQKQHFPSGSSPFLSAVAAVEPPALAPEVSEPSPERWLRKTLGVHNLLNT